MTDDFQSQQSHKSFKIPVQQLYSLNRVLSQSNSVCIEKCLHFRKGYLEGGEVLKDPLSDALASESGEGD